MRRLGYTRYVAQGGELGHADLQRDGTPGRRGAARHSHQLAGDRPAEVAAALAGGPVPAGLTDKEARGARCAHDVREKTETWRTSR